MRHLKLFFLFVGLLSFSKINAQPKDSTIYKNIEAYSKKNKTTKLLHKLIFRSDKPNKIKTENIHDSISIKANGKIIRNIKIVILDPFGFSVTDTTTIPENWSERAGNRLHLKTQHFAIKNLLLFKKNTPYDAYKSKESERIIRAQKYINQVLIREQMISPESDSIDVIVRVLDSWSFLPKFEISASKIQLGFDERNIFGTGHQLKYNLTNRFDDWKKANTIEYYIPNIKNTFIVSQIKYNIDLNNYYQKSINIERIFYSPLTKWAGGIYVAQNFRKENLPNTDMDYEMQNFKYNTHDFWVGHAFQIYKEKTNRNRKTNFVISGRFSNVNFLEKPTIAYNLNNFFSSQQLVLAGFGINTREYVKDHYLFRYGITEDVPVGRVFGITTGYQYKNNLWKPYLGAQASFGDYFKWGFLSANFEFGTYFNNGKTYQTAFNFQTNYFTNLIEIGSWKLRQFIKPQLIIGINRENNIGDLLNSSENNNLQQLNDKKYGRSKLMLSLQTQTYTPKEVLGFRLNPYLNYSIGLLGTNDLPVAKGKAFSRISLGLLINNDYLVFSSFQISISYYPSVPYQGNSNFQTNAFETTDFGFQTFEFGKPRIVDYN